MWISRVILLLLGLWLLRQVLRLFRGSSTRQDAEIRSAPKRDPVNPIQNGRVRDAEFEELHEPEDRTGDRE